MQKFCQARFNSAVHFFLCGSQSRYDLSKITFGRCMITEWVRQTVPLPLRSPVSSSIFSSHGVLEHVLSSVLNSSNCLKVQVLHSESGAVVSILVFTECNCFYQCQTMRSSGTPCPRCTELPLPPLPGSVLSARIGTLRELERESDLTERALLPKRVVNSDYAPQVYKLTKLVINGCFNVLLLTFDIFRCDEYEGNFYFCTFLEGSLRHLVWCFLFHSIHCHYQIPLFCDDLAG